MARALAPPGRLHVHALHLWPADRVWADSFADLDDACAHPLEPLLAAATDIEVEPHCFVSRDVGADVTALARQTGADLVLMGWHRPVTSQSILSGPIATVMQEAHSDVAVYMVRQFRPWRRVLVPYFGGPHDRGALELARRIGVYSGLRLTLLHVVAPERADDAPRLGLSEAASDFEADGVHLKVIESTDPVETLVRETWLGYDLVVLGASDVWGMEPKLFSTRHERLAFATPASLLVVRKFVPSKPERPAHLLSEVPVRGTS